MAAAAGSIIGGLLSSTNQAGQKETTNMGQNSQGGSISNANSNTPDIKTAEVKDAAKPMQQNGTPVETEKSQANGTGKDWSKLADMAQNLMSSGGQSQNMNFNATSQAQPLATFR